MLRITNIAATLRLASLTLREFWVLSRRPVACRDSDRRCFYDSRDPQLVCRLILRLSSELSTLCLLLPIVDRVFSRRFFYWGFYIRGGALFYYYSCWDFHFFYGHCRLRFLACQAVRISFDWHGAMEVSGHPIDCTVLFQVGQPQFPFSWFYWSFWEPWSSLVRFSRRLCRCSLEKYLSSWYAYYRKAE